MCGGGHRLHSAPSHDDGPGLSHDARKVHRRVQQEEFQTAGAEVGCRGKTPASLNLPDNENSLDTDPSPRNTIARCSAIEKLGLAATYH